MHMGKHDLSIASTFMPRGGGQASVEGNSIPLFMWKSTVIISVALKLMKGGK